MISPDDPRDGDALDRMIDRALRSESMRRPPAHLFHEIQGRVRVAAVVQKVRRRIWVVAGAWLAGGGATAAAVVLAARGLRVSDVLVEAFPGALGYADYLTSFYATGPQAGMALLIPVAAVGTLLTAALGASWLSAQRQTR